MKAVRVTVEAITVAVTATEPSSIRVWDPKSTSVEASPTLNTDGLGSPRSGMLASNLHQLFGKLPFCH